MRVVAPLLLAFAIAATASSGAAEPTVQIFLLAGQSNMVGRGEPISAGTGPVDANLLVYRDGGWQVAGDPLGPDNDQERGVGPGMTFGLGALSHEPPGTKVGLIMCARGGTSIDAWRRTSGLFTNCQKMAKAAGGTVAGIVFLQGEFEANSAQRAAHWQQKFETVEQDFQNAFGPVPFVLGQIGNITRPYAQVVRDGQTAAASELPPVSLVPSLDLPLQPDGVHFTADAAKTLGSRYADAWWSLFQAFPRLTDVSPLAGEPGTPVTLTGNALDSATGVTFGGAPAGFTVDGPGQLTAIVPDDGISGLVTVTTPYGALKWPGFSVQPAINSFSPMSGRIGTKVLVSAEGLASRNGHKPKVTVGGQTANVVVLSSTQMRIVIPKKAVTGPITLTTPGGTAVSTLAFTVVP